MKIHIVKKGDTLYLLAQKYNVSLEKVIAANPQLADPNQLSIGEKIKIPADPVAMQEQPSTVYQHKVKQGDSLWKLSKAWGVPLKLIIDANSQLKNPNALLVGETVNIPQYKGEANSPASDQKKNTGVKQEPTKPEAESPAPTANNENENLPQTKAEQTLPKAELTQPKPDNTPIPKEQMTQPKETVNVPKLPELKMPEIPATPVNPAPPQPIASQPVQPKPQLPANVELQPVTEKFCGCTNSEAATNSQWPMQQPMHDYNSPANMGPNSWYPGIGVAQPWGNASVNTSFVEQWTPSVAPNQGYQQDCEHPWSWGPAQTAPINVQPTPYPVYQDCMCPGYHPSYEAAENTSYPVYPPFIHQGYPQHPESAAQGSQWGHEWGSHHHGLPMSGYVSDNSQLQGQQSANLPHHPFAHENAPVYPLEGYTTPYMFLPDCGCREGNVESVPAFPGTQENSESLNNGPQNEVNSSPKHKDSNVRKGKGKDTSGSAAKEDTSKAKVSGKNGTDKNQKSRKTVAMASHSTARSARSRKNPWIKD
ncbi:peptidoglycan-binding protein LysM [Paenibacillus terrae]|uniref:Peptidoglycan-binding protein LysM n=1 Tax=Paenibacillus terrae TaxID=159743 RepID=A0A4U2Q8J7_9BACL|nr:LysM peptidoglycan-binding domain-containing protein [Paenibacillus terrae]TKH46574.1 peptidoglycan-binding protein LysM [Paenibacillus terrae]